ncbi:hypothetical protein ATCC90586_002750 [Pythium insidiosum]|nr:hypothetical protein ATCC90586_002750 [Pythium insidiosum]
MRRRRPSVESELAKLKKASEDARRTDEERKRRAEEAERKAEEARQHWLQACQLPPGLNDVLIAFSNLSTLPGDSAWRWHPMSAFYLEYSGPRDFPLALYDLSVYDLSLVGKKLTTVSALQSISGGFCTLSLSHYPIFSIIETLPNMSTGTLRMGFLAREWLLSLRRVGPRSAIASASAERRSALRTKAYKRSALAAAAITLAAAATTALLLALLLLRGTLPLSGGGHVLGRFTLGYFLGFMLGAIDVLVGVTRAADSMLVVADIVAARVETQRPLLWLAVITLNIVLLSRIERTVWRVTRLLGVVALISVTGFVLGSLRYSNPRANVVRSMNMVTLEAQSDSLVEILRVLPLLSP